MSDTPTMQDVMEGVKTLREEFEKKSPDFAKIDKIEAVLEKQEEKNQQLLTDTKTAEKSAEELKERLDTLEIELARSGGAGEGKNYKDSDEYKSLKFFVQKGDLAVMASEEHKAILRTDSDSQGGFLVPTEMDNVIVKKITEISNIRAIARVRTVSAKSLEIPVRNTIPVAEYEGEAEEGTEDTSTYENESLTPFRQTVTIPITRDLLMDSAFDMEAEIMGDGGESFALGEGNAFVVGTGFKQPEGFTVDTRVVANARTSATSGTIGFDDMMLITGDLKPGYNPTYVFNRRTLAFLRTLKGGDSHPLWQPGMNGIVMNTINGFPYLIANAMPDIALNSISVAFGDFARGYTITDRTGMAVIRDEITSKKKAIIEFTLMRWNTGKVTLPEAIKLLKTKA